MPTARFTLVISVVMASTLAIAMAVAVSAACSSPVAPERRRSAPAGTRPQPTPVNLDEIKDPAVRPRFDDRIYFFSPDHRLARMARKHEGGFGGYSFDRTDRNHVYVYMVYISKTAAAEAAFRQAAAMGCTR